MHRRGTAAERLSALSTREREIVRQCLNAAVIGPFFPDWEFSTIFGVHRFQVADVLKMWPQLPTGEEIVELSINNTLANLLWYPHGEFEAWSQLIQATPGDVERIFYKWRGDDPDTHLETMK